MSIECMSTLYSEVLGPVAEEFEADTVESPAVPGTNNVWILSTDGTPTAVVKMPSCRE